MLTLRICLAVVLGALTLRAQSEEPIGNSSKPGQPGFAFSLTPPSGRICDVLPSCDANAQNVPRPRAVAYSKGYETRLKIHKYASYATLPLFVAEVAVGQKLYDGEDGSLRSAHSGLAAGIAVLFGVNSVTGVWNLYDERKNPAGRGKRMLHGILMLAADAGFVATAALAPHREERQSLPGSGRGTHRAVAITSIGIATFSYLYMLFAQ